MCIVPDCAAYQVRFWNVEFMMFVNSGFSFFWNDWTNRLAFAHIRNVIQTTPVLNALRTVIYAITQMETEFFFGVVLL